MNDEAPSPEPVAAHRPHPGGAVVGFVRGFALPLQAANLLLNTRGVKRFALLPLIVNIVLYGLIILLFIWLMSGWNVQVGEWEFLWGVGGWLSTAINWILGPLKWIVAIPFILVICYFTFTMVGMIVAAPFNDMLSERVERAICNPKEDVKLPLVANMRVMVLSITDALAIVLWQVLFSIAAIPLLIIPVIGFLPLMLVTAYFTGLGFIDVAMARNLLRNRHKQPMIREDRAAILGMGLCMEFLFFIPFAGMFMLPIGVVAGTMLYCDHDWERTLAAAGIEHPRGFVPPKKAQRAGRSRPPIADNRPPTV